MISRVEVISPSRLHFGLYSFGHSHARQFGGVGAMIDSPQVHLIATVAEQFRVTGTLQERVEIFAQRWCEFHRQAAPPNCEIQLLQVPPEHNGLGVGTQLGLSVATALNTFVNFAQPTPLELALSVGRGLRSAVGTYGFLLGGLIAERGKLPHESVSRLDVRVTMPSNWRFVLVTPKHQDGLHGSHEVQAFSQLPPVSPAITEQLVSLVREQLVPAAVSADFEQFSDALFAYCHTAGEFFASIQGGAYNGPVLQALVEQIRALGVTGVGQSSRGPTLFCLLPDQQKAQDFATSLGRARYAGDIEIQITQPNNSGVKVNVD